MAMEQSTNWLWVGIWVAGLVCGGAGLLLLVRGMIGRRIDDHPLCRACGFDLTGRAEGSDRCPECGRDVTQPKAIRHGHRQRRGGLIAAGVAGILLGLAFLSPTVIATATSFDPQLHKPMWLLQREAHSANAQRRDAAIAEMERRLTAGLLSRDAVASIVSRALDLQGDPNQPWNRKWGDMIERARAQQQVSDDQWILYARQAVQMKLHVRENVRRGDPMPLGIQNVNARAGSNTRLTLGYDSRDDRFSVDELEFVEPKDRAYGSGSTSVGSRSVFFRVYNPTPLLDRLADGKHVFRFRSKLYIRENPDDTKTLATIDLDLSETFDLRPSDEPIVTLTTDASLLPGIQHAITVTGVSVYRYGESSASLRVSVKVDEAPAGLAHMVWLRAGEREWKVGSLSRPAGQRSFAWSIGSNVPGFSPDIHTVDVCFRPDPTVAAMSLDVLDIWGKELVVKGVKVSRPSLPSTVPTDGR
ncbi:MAG TPA: hypothetical protein VGN72_21240 [Tepidisphaeraceae bacterium]|jgi:predicted RNA-binding Zn-ribbon protein involved in translation (DUF1610 family)|nr:hypothetical protein [Tepidisphaeraceae bacterium]